jgi:hypothetical protein
MSNYEDEYADLMEQLQAERPSAPEPNQQFSDGLRGHLLAKYDKQTGWGIGRLTGAATALALFALVVFVGWYLASSQQPSTLVGSGIETTRPAETADSVNELEVTHTTLRVSRVMDEAYTWNVTIEHWQTADGKYTRTMIINEAGELLHFAQSDGTYLWLSKGINAITSQNRRVLDFSQQARVDYVLLDEVPAFFANVGWDNLGQAVIGTDPDCQTDQCKYERLEEPPALGVDPEAFAAGQYGYGVSLIGTEEVNGHVVDVFRFSYKESGSESEETLLPYHRIAKVDAETSAVISITDFNGNKVLRHIERVAQETIMMAANDFKVLPSSAFAALPKRTPQTFAFEDGFQLIGYALLPDQQGDGLQVNVF